MKIKNGMLAALVAIFFGLLIAAKAQTFEVKRAEAAYHPDSVLDPATLLSPRNFSDTESGRYVVVEGYIDYVATAWPETDGDYHFEMRTTKKLFARCQTTVTPPPPTFTPMPTMGGYSGGGH